MVIIIIICNLASQLIFPIYLAPLLKVCLALVYKECRNVFG